MARILFFSEPFPLFSQVHFFSGLSVLLKKRGFQTYNVVTDRRTKKLADKNGFSVGLLDFDRAAAAAGGYPLTPHEVEEAFFYKKKLGMEEDETFLRKRAARIADVVGACLNERRIAVIVFWNIKNPAQIIARTVARQMKIETIIFETGFAEGTIQVGTEGVNAQNHWLTSSADSDLWNTFWRDEHITYAHTLQSPGAGRVSMKLPARFFRALKEKGRRFRKRHPEAYIENSIWQALKYNVYHAGFVRDFLLKSERRVTLPRDFYFIPFQVHDDSNIILHSPFIRDMEALLRVSYASIRSNKKDASIVVKEHPADFGRVNYSHLKRVFPDVLFLRHTPVAELIARARALITINSTVGFEALQRFKPVITLGSAFYDCPGVTYHASSECELVNLMKKDSLAVDRARIERYLADIEKRFILCDWRRHDSAGLENIARFFTLYLGKRLRS